MKTKFLDFIAITIITLAIIAVLFGLYLEFKRAPIEMIELVGFWAGMILLFWAVNRVGVWTEKRKCFICGGAKHKEAKLVVKKNGSRLNCAGDGG